MKTLLTLPLICFGTALAVIADLSGEAADWCADAVRVIWGNDL